MNGDTPTQDTQAQPQAQPQGQPGTPDQGQYKQILDQVIRSMKGKTEMSPMKIDPKMGKVGLGPTVGNMLLNMFVPGVGSALQSHIKQQKETQINQIVNWFTILHDGWENAQVLANGDQEKAKQLFGQMESVKAVLGDKKNQKLLSKAFGVDLMNPEKTQNNVAFQGLQKFLKIKQAKGQMESAKAMVDQIKGQGQTQSPQQEQKPQQGQPGGPQSPQAGGQNDPAQQMLGRWPMKAQQPSMADVEKAAMTVKDVVSAQQEQEPKTEFQGWYKAKKAQFGEVTPEMIEAHHNAMRMKPIEQLQAEAIDLIQSGDTEGGQQALELAQKVRLATTNTRAPNKWDLISRSLKGDKEARDMLAYQHNEDTELREAYGKGRAKYILKNFKMPDGSTKTMSEYQFIEGQRHGLYQGVMMINNLTTEQIGAIQRMQTEIGPKDTEFYKRGVLKGLYDNIDVFDDAKTMAIFARAMSRAKPDSDMGQFIHNVIDQVTQEKLDENGMRALAYMNRLNESMGTLRRAGFLPSTESSQELMYRLSPGGGSANSAQVKIELDNLNEMVINATEIPMYTGKGSKPDKKKMTLDEWLNQK